MGKRTKIKKTVSAELRDRMECIIGIPKGNRLVSVSVSPACDLWNFQAEVRGCGGMGEELSAGIIFADTKAVFTLARHIYYLKPEWSIAIRYGKTIASAQVEIEVEFEEVEL